MDNRIIFTILLIFLVILLFSVILKFNKKEHFEFDPYHGRKPGEIKCCGNMDWYLGNKYPNYCGNVKPSAFVKTEIIEGFEIDTEMTAKDAYVGNQQYYSQDEKCKQENQEWKAAYTPMVCTQGNKIIAEANCQCMDKKNQCTKCFDKIDLSKYT